jgi:hypothetical protein
MIGNDPHKALHAVSLVLAGASTRVAHSLYMAHAVAFHELSLGELVQQDPEATRRSRDSIRGLERAVVEAVRIELGLGPSVIGSIESPIRRLLGWISG